MGLFGFGKKKEAPKVEEVKEVEVAKEVVEEAAAPAQPAQPKAEGENVSIRIFCSAGASTSLWAQNVQKSVDAAGRGMTVEAFSISVLDDEAKSADVILIGPQTRYVENEVKEKFPEKTVAVVPMQTFGLMNGDKGLEFIDTLIK